MNNALSSYNLGRFQTVESCQKISVNQLVRTATKDLKKRIVEAQIEALGIPVSLTTSKTKFSGTRLWFECPACGRRVGVIYKNHSNVLGCLKCLRLIYQQQKYRGM